MLKFLKKKKKDTDETDPSKKKTGRKDKEKSSEEEKPSEEEKEKKRGDGGKDSLQEGVQTEGEKKPEKKKRKKLSKKLFFIVFLVLLALGASVFVVYKFYFAPKDPESLKTVYQKIELKHINLPEEMIRFCFDHFPDLYAAILDCNSEIGLIDKEIARIDEIAKKYPEQGKIAEKEKAVWEKTKINLQKSFLKIEKAVKEIYVLFRVNKEQAMVQINEKNKELTELAEAALAPARELTKTSLQEEAPPQGLFQGTLYKLKKKFL